ncbi:MAG: beta-ketoacyl-ACP synthase III [Pseudomonadota bacterium]
MSQAAITGSGVYTPPDAITNAELVDAYTAYADRQNQRNAAAIAQGTSEPCPETSTRKIQIASGIRQRFVVDRAGVLDPDIMHPVLRERADTEPGLMAEMALKASADALRQADCAPEQLDAVICAASNHERPYPAIAIEIQNLLGAHGFAFDMNVACSSATFAIQVAADMIRCGTLDRALVVCPEICSAHLDWRDADSHFIFGDVCTAVVLERADAARVDHFAIRSTHCVTRFSNNIRNNNGFLRRTRPGHMDDRRDMLFRQDGREVFRDVLPMVVDHIGQHLDRETLPADRISRLWLHQANRTMNDYIGRKVLGRKPESSEQPNILQDYANTSSAGAIVAFSHHSDDLGAGALGVICSFGAGYSVGSVLLERRIM